MRSLTIAFAAAVAIALGMAGCSDSSPAPTPSPSVSSVSVTGSTPNVGATTQFSATATLSNGTTQAVTSQASWQSTDTTVATVSSSGAVTGVDGGNADVRATYSGVAGSLGIAVPAPPTHTLVGVVT